jgi:predicted metal-dependent hydrolase
LRAGLNLWPSRPMPKFYCGARPIALCMSQHAAVLFTARAIAHLKRRLADWLKREARRDLTIASERHAQAMAVSFRRLAIRDQASRWGSCSSDGSLSYSWRLILAPSFVLDYVAAHEVAHLKHMNHGVRFWRLVLTHCPMAPQARLWLKRHGATLHRFGA